MDKSSSLAPFAFILHRSSPGSEHSCFWPARKLHLKLALWSEWLISHLAGMKVNERSKETASPLLYTHPRHASPIYENLSSACSRWLPEKVSESCIIGRSGGKKSKMEAGVHFPWPPVNVEINPRLFLLVCSAPSCFQPLCCKSVWFLLWRACFSENEWKSLNFTDLLKKLQLNRTVRWLSLWIEIDHFSTPCLLGFRAVNEQKICLA